MMLLFCLLRTCYSLESIKIQVMSNYNDEAAMEHLAGDGHIAFGYNLIAVYEQKVAEVKTLFPQDTAV